MKRVKQKLNDAGEKYAKKIEKENLGVRDYDPSKAFISGGEWMLENQWHTEFELPEKENPTQLISKECIVLVRFYRDSNLEFPQTAHYDFSEKKWSCPEDVKVKYWMYIPKVSLDVDFAKDLIEHPENYKNFKEIHEDNKEEKINLNDSAYKEDQESDPDFD